MRAALDGNDPSWRERELIIFPSHRVSSRSSPDDIDEMIELAHESGFDAICASLIITGADGDDIGGYAHIWRKHWDERWTLPNPRTENWQDQSKRLGATCGPGFADG